jgi:hypothetical protein
VFHKITKSIKTKEVKQTALIFCTGAFSFLFVCFVTSSIKNHVCFYESILDYTNRNEGFVSAFIGIITCLSTIGFLYFTWKSVKASEEAVKASKEAVVVSKESVKISEKQLRNSNFLHLWEIRANCFNEIEDILISLSDFKDCETAALYQKTSARINSVRGKITSLIEYKKFKDPLECILNLLDYNNKTLKDTTPDTLAKFKDDVERDLLLVKNYLNRLRNIHLDVNNLKN